MNRLLKTLLAAAAAGGTAVLLARLLRTAPPPSADDTNGGPLIDADAFSEDERRMLLAELDAHVGGENA